MITKETAQKIWSAYNQIEEANNIISTMKEEISKTGKHESPDWTGRKGGLEMGIPSMGGGHRILQVRVDLGLQIIECHIEEQQNKLRELMAYATIELKG
jgi:hypothetical protein